MARFKMDREFNLSGYGHGIQFIPGEYVNVPPELHAEALRCGAEPEDRSELDLPANAQQLPTDKGNMDLEERKIKIMEAMDTLVRKNERMSFGANGMPTILAIYRECGIQLIEPERNQIWSERQQLINALDRPSNTNQEVVNRNKKTAERIEEEKPKPRRGRPPKKTAEKTDDKATKVA